MKLCRPVIPTPLERSSLFEVVFDQSLTKCGKLKCYTVIPNDTFWAPAPERSWAHTEKEKIL